MVDIEKKLKSYTISTSYGKLPVYIMLGECTVHQKSKLVIPRETHNILKKKYLIKNYVLHHTKYGIFMCIDLKGDMPECGQPEYLMTPTK